MSIIRSTSDPAKATSSVERGGRTVHFTETHVGLVVRLHEQYVGDGESVDEAVVHDPAADIFALIRYCSSRCYDGCRATVDAPAALVERYEREEAERRAAAAAAYEERLAAETRELAWHTLRPGSIVEVSRGRKVPVGTRGEVFWVGGGNYGIRAGIDIGSERLFIAASNLTILEQPGYGSLAYHTDCARRAA